MQELRDIHTDLTEEDIAALATARLAEEQPRDRMWYRINAVKVLGGKSKLQPTVNARLASVTHAAHSSLLGMPLLHCALSLAVQCIVSGPVCLFV